MARQRSTATSKASARALPNYLDVPPRFGTLRNFENPTYGAHLAKVHFLLNRKKPMPWQQYVYDVLGEVDPKTGIRVYRDGFLSTMRQVGKTTELRTFKAHRAIDCTEPQTIQFAAQDGVEAKKKWLQHAAMIKKTPLAARLLDAAQPVTSNGKEALYWASGSVEFPISSKPSSGHGDTLDLGVVTEAFSQTDDRYEQTMRPAMIARPDAQYLAESTAGTALSLYWNSIVDEHRERLTEEPDRPSRVAFFDWSFGPDEDPGSPATWQRRIPAIGHTMRLDEIQHAWDTATTPKKLAAFMRSTGNITDSGIIEASSIFPDEDWSNTATDETAIAGARSFGLDITNDRSWSSIAQAGPNLQGVMQPEIVAHERGTHWVIGQLVALFEENSASARRVYVVAGGQAALMASEIEKKDIEVIVLARADYAAGCAKVYDEVTERRLVHRQTGQIPLDVAVAGAAWTTRGDARVWDRAKSTTIISPLVAATAARWGFEIDLAAAYDPMANIF